MLLCSHCKSWGRYLHAVTAQSSLQRPAVHRHPPPQQCGPSGGELHWQKPRPDISLELLSLWGAGLLHDGSAAVQLILPLWSCRAASPVLLEHLEPLTCQDASLQEHSGLQGLYLLAVGQTKAGLAVGTTTSAALLLLDIKRAYDVGELAVLLISAPDPCLVSPSFVLSSAVRQWKSSYGLPVTCEQTQKNIFFIQIRI